MSTYFTQTTTYWSWQLDPSSVDSMSVEVMTVHSVAVSSGSANWPLIAQIQPTKQHDIFTHLLHQQQQTNQLHSKYTS